MRLGFLSALIFSAFSSSTAIFAENPPANCAGGETFKFIVQGSINGGATWSSNSANVYGYGSNAPDINLTIRTLMTVTSGQTQGWSFSMKHDPSYIKYYGGDFTLTSVTTSGTGTATVQGGYPPSTNNTAKRTGFNGYTQGIVIDGGGEITLGPTTNFVTSKACYHLKFPRYNNYAQITLKFTHDIGTPGVRSLVTQGGTSHIPCAQNFTFYIYTGSYTPTVGGCPAGMSMSMVEGSEAEDDAGDVIDPEAPENLQPLPDPGLDLPVDIDGDGVSAFHDKYLFNLWLQMGGGLDAALSAAEVKNDILDLSNFTGLSTFLVPPVTSEDAEDAIDSSSKFSTVDTVSTDIEYVRRIPPNVEPSCGVNPPNCQDPASTDIRTTPVGPDGYFVVFSSKAKNLPLGPGGPGNPPHPDPDRDIYHVYWAHYNIDGTLNEDMVLLSHFRDTTNGTFFSLNSRHPSISDDGQVVAFESLTFPNEGYIDENLTWDIFVCDFTNRFTLTFPLCITRKIDQNGHPTNTTANDSSRGPCISGDGQFVVFSSKADDLVNVGPTPIKGVWNVYRLNMASVLQNAPELISVDSSNPVNVCDGIGCYTFDSTFDPINGYSVGKVVNFGADLVVFSGQPHVNFQDPFNIYDGGHSAVFMHQISQESKTFLVSAVNVNGVNIQASANCTSPSISSKEIFNGTSNRGRIVFISDSGYTPAGSHLDIIYNDVNDEIFLNTQKKPVKVTQTLNGSAAGDGDSISPMISQNGTHIAFISKAANLANPASWSSCSPGSCFQAMVKHLGNNPPPQPQQDAFDFYSLSSGGVAGNGDVASIDVVSNMNMAVFDSDADNLIGENQDLNIAKDLFQSKLNGNYFKRGDVDANAAIEITDIVRIISYLFLSGGEPPCVDAADTNDDGIIDLSDAITLINAEFLGGTMPAPSEYCGIDLTTDSLLCNVNTGACQ